MDAFVPFAQLPGASKFLVDYVSGARRAIQWFDYDPHQDTVLETRLNDLQAGTIENAADRAELAEVVLRQQERWRAGEQARAAAAALGRGNTYAIATGQQVGLFGGPLYTIHKAVCTVNWARRLRRLYPDNEFVPVFWMGTSDSDFEEVRHCWLLSAAGEPLAVSLPPPPADQDGIPVRNLDVRAGLDAALADLDQTVPPGLWQGEVVQALRSAYADGGLTEGFARWMAQLFRDTELVLLDAQDPALMRAARPLIRRELATAADTQELLSRRSAEIAAAGYTPQVDQLPGDTGLFVINDTGRREKLALDETGFYLRQSGRRLALAELEPLCEQAPERFITGVALRPIYQNSLFPVALFVGGAAELAYRAQLIPLFHHHQQKMAPAFLRSAATLLPAKSAQLLAELDLSLPDVLVPPQDLLGRVVNQEMPPEIARALAGYRAAIGGADAELRRVAGELDAGLDQAFATLHGNLERHLDKLEKKIISSLKRRHEGLAQRVTRLSNLVWPRLTAQERVLSVSSFLTGTGFDLIPQLVEELTVPQWVHQTVILE
ncbi:bacillithiol biosynthesis cysteine-adding enzyme BshC [bacterium]|nr:bacillithiol biosynthesis cysteine-adding enzyme BshC [bacterium]